MNDRICLSNLQMIPRSDRRSADHFLRTLLAKCPTMILFTTILRSIFETGYLRSMPLKRMPKTSGLRIRESHMIHNLPMPLPVNSNKKHTNRLLDSISTLISISIFISTDLFVKLKRLCGTHCVRPVVASGIQTLDNLLRHMQIGNHQIAFFQIVWLTKNKTCDFSNLFLKLTNRVLL